MRRAGSVALAASLLLAAGLAGAPVAGATPPLPDPAKEYWFGNYQIPKIWALGATGRGVTVAVLDTGVDANAPELRGVVLRGTDLAGGDGRTDTETPRGHGTAMARYIAGQGGGRQNLVGIAPDAKILPVTVNNQFSTALDAAESGSRGINYAAAHGARVINISQGTAADGEPGQCPQSVAAAVRGAIAKGAVVVAAAGNEALTGNPPEYPAACPGVLAVGAVDGSKVPWPKSQRQSYVDVAAPGVDMPDVNLQGAVGVSSGTSNAAALVSGAIALVWSKFPTLTNRQVVARLLATVTDDGAHPGRDTATGYGIVRPYNAITARVPANAPNRVFDELTAAPSAPGGSSGATSVPARPSSSPATQANGGPVSSGRSSGGSTTAILIAVLAGLLGLGIILALMRRRRRAALYPPGTQPPGTQPPRSPPPLAYRPPSQPAAPPPQYPPQS